MLVCPGSRCPSRRHGKHWEKKRFFRILRISQLDLDLCKRYAIAFVLDIPAASSWGDAVLRGLSHFPRAGAGRTKSNCGCHTQLTENDRKEESDPEEDPDRTQGLATGHLHRDIGAVW